MGLLSKLTGGSSGGGVNVGSAIAYLELNTEAFDKGLKSAVSQLDATKGPLATSLNNIGSSMKSAGSTLTKTVTLPIVGVGAAAVKSFGDFEDEMAKVKAISGEVADAKSFQRIIDTADQMGLSYERSGNMTETAMNIVKAKAEEMGATTEWTSTEAAEAFRYMAMAGWDVGDMLLGIEPVMNLATASGEDLGTTSDIVTDSLTAFGLSAKDTTHYTDLLAQVARTSNTNVTMMGESFKFAAPVMGSMGMSADDCALALGLMANNGIKSGMAGRALRNILTNLVKPTDESAAAMEELGIKIENDDGSTKSFKEILDQLRKAFNTGNGDVKTYTASMAKLDEQYASGQITEEEYEESAKQLATSLYGVEGAHKAELAAMLAGKQGMSGLLAIVNTTESDYNKLSDAIDNCDGATNEMATTMRNTTQGSLKLMMSAIDALLRSFGELLAPVIQKVAGFIQNLANKFNALDDSTKETIVKVGAIAAAIGPLLVILGTLLSSIGSIISVMGKLGGVFTGIIGHFLKTGSAASTLSGGLSSAGSAASSAAGSFGTFAGQALKLAAVAVVILAAAQAVKMLAESAMELYNAGPGAIATFAGLTVAAIAITAAIAGIASACTAGAAGLLSLGASVLMVSAGIALVTAAIALLVEAFADLLESFVPLADKMPVFAEYGTKAALSMGQFGAAALLAAPAIAALDLALAGLALSAAIVDPLLIALNAGMAALNLCLIALSATLTVFGEAFSSTLITMTQAADQSVRMIMQLISDLVDGIIELFKRLKYELIGDPIVLDIVDGVVGAFFEMVQNVIDFISGLVEKIVEFFSGILEKLQGLIDAMKERWQLFKEWLLDIWNGAKEDFVNVWTSIKDFFVEIWNGAKQAFMEIWNAIKEYFIELWDSFVQKVSDAIDSIIKFVTDMWDKAKAWFENVKKTISDLFDNIKKIFQGLFEWISREGQGLIKRASEAIGNFVKNAIEKIKNLKDDAIKLIKGLFDEAKKKADEGFKWIREKASGFFKDAIKAVKDFINDTLDKIKDFKDRIFDAAKAIFDEVKKKFEDTLKIIKENIEAVVKTVREKIDEIIKTVKEKIEQIVKTVKEKIEDLIKTIKDKIQELIKTITQKLKDVADTIYKGLKDILNKTSEVIKLIWDKVVGFAKEVISNVSNFMQNLITTMSSFGLKMVQLGKDLFNKLWEGIKFVWNEITNWVTDKFNWVVGQISGIIDRIRSAASEISGFIDGSHATGLSYVPFNGYIAQLHEGERVLTKQENREYSQGRSGGGDTYNIYSYEKLDEYNIRRELEKMKRQLDL